ncbi:MAG: hypothetical protein AUK48_04655 [Oscillatoriales cyanobacterium CG2_30_44_21]|nr:MAG: hypothetical protein AUK48_04655 [Oscillatoriales cyanobacterium CG2_30_44_21]
MDWLKRLSILGTTAIASTVIAQSASAQFVVFVAGNDPATLQRVRAVSPAAFPTKINDQPIVQAGTFRSESSADTLAFALQQSGLSAQKYFRASGGKESNVPVPFPENSAVVSPLPSPQQVVIQPEPQQVLSSTFNSVPQQAITYTNQPQYQQITTNTVVPQVQTQQVLVPRWQQVMVPELRQVVTQTVVPQTQVLQTGYVQSGYIQQPTNFAQSQLVQPQLIQSEVLQQPQILVQSSSQFVSTGQIVPTSFDNSSIATSSFVSAAPQTFSSNEQVTSQQSQNSAFRYVAAVPSTANNQFLLSRVRQYVPGAFFANSGRGAYINAGAYQSRDSAESISRYLRSQGLDSRVLYF